MTERTEAIWEFVRSVHDGQLYDGLPYEIGHLRVVHGIGIEAGMTSESDEIIFASHDSIEDAKDDQHRRWVYDFLSSNLTEHEFAVVWALTGLGSNRRERNADAYAKIAAYAPAADFKVVDRLANWENAKRKGLSLANMYAREDVAFRENVLIHATNPYVIARYNALSA